MRLVRSLDDVLLDAPGCPICAVCAEAEERFFRWFEIESFTEPGMHARLRRSVGFCPAHQRHVLRQAQLSPAPAIVAGALDQLAADAPANGECPACERVGEARERSLSRLGRAMLRAELRTRYEKRPCGACLPHVVEAVGSQEAEPAELLARRLRRDLASDAPFALVAGRDDDAPVRVGLRAALPAQRLADPGTTGEAERGSWAVMACPVCYAAGRAERRYLEWRRREERTDATDLRNEPGVLCAGHLHELATADEDAGARAAARVRAYWLAEFDRFLAWADVPPDSGGPARRRRGARAPTRLRPAPCPACEAREGAAARRLDLVLRLLARPDYARAYEAAHGLCLRHALAAGSGPVASFVQKELAGAPFRARLGDRRGGAQAALGCPA